MASDFVAPLGTDLPIASVEALPSIRVRPRISIPSDRLAEFCRREGIRKLSLFGSVLRDDFRPESDIDVLVEYVPNQAVGFRVLALEEELATLFGGLHRVDLVNAKYLNPRLRDQILGSSQVQYEQG